MIEIVGKIYVKLFMFIKIFNIVMFVVFFLVYKSEFYLIKYLNYKMKFNRE